MNAEDHEQSEIHDLILRYLPRRAPGCWATPALLQSKYGQSRSGTLDFLMELPEIPNSVTTAAIALLNDPHYKVRAMAVRVLSAKLPKDQADKLLASLRDDDEIVRSLIDAFRKTLL